MLRKWLIIGFISLAGCSSTNDSPDKDTSKSKESVVGGVVSGTFHGAIAAITMPFEDIGLKRQDIPEKLQKIALNPYALPTPMQCSSIRREIGELDTLLGPDECLPAQKADGDDTDDYTQKGANLATSGAVGFVRSQVNFIPYRGIVRQVTGAEKHSKEVQHAYEAGKMRRAFLKGLGGALGHGCMDTAVAKKTNKADKPDKSDKS